MAALAVDANAGSIDLDLAEVASIGDRRDRRQLRVGHDPPAEPEHDRQLSVNAGSAALCLPAGAGLRVEARQRRCLERLRRSRDEPGRRGLGDPWLRDGRGPDFAQGRRQRREPRPRPAAPMRWLMGRAAPPRQRHGRRAAPMGPRPMIHVDVAPGDASSPGSPALGVVLGLVLLVRGFVGYRSAAGSAGTSVSRIASLAVGEVLVSGTAEPIELTLVSPLQSAPCVYYRSRITRGERRRRPRHLPRGARASGSGSATRAARSGSSRAAPASTSPIGSTSAPAARGGARSACSRGSGSAFGPGRAIARRRSPRC